jgi:hypothetical protein
MDECDSGMGPVVGFCECSEELSDSITGGEFPDKLRSIASSKTIAPWSGGEGCCPTVNRTVIMRILLSPMRVRQCNDCIQCEGNATTKI